MSNLNDHASLQLRNTLGKIELNIVRLITNEPKWLNNNESSALRWALSLARLTKVHYKEGNKAKSLPIAHLTDRYRAELFALLSSAINPTGQINKESLIRVLPQVSALVKKERQDLLEIFANNFSKSALDEAIRKRPLALTLGGGGGSAYVFMGAFSALEEHGIIPDIISGSSMGAVLGAYRALNKNFSLKAIDELILHASWDKITEPFSGISKFGIPATFKLHLRNVLGEVFAKNGGFVSFKDLAIPLRVCIAGLSSANFGFEGDFEQYAKLFGQGYEGIKNIKNKHSLIVSKIMEFAQKPLKAIYVGGDEISEKLDVLDAVGFSSAIPGIFHYDVLEKDAKSVEILNLILKKEGVVRLIDGGFVDNLPVKEIIQSIEQGALESFDPFVLALDCFSPSLNRHWFFYPLMLFAAENSKEGHALAHLSIKFKKVLSPIHFVPNQKTFSYALKSGYEEISEHLPFIRKMLGPIPDPVWL